MDARKVIPPGKNGYSFPPEMICAPTVKAPVHEYVRQLGAPFLLREIYVPLGLPRQVVRRELNRMVKKGLLVRGQIMAPVQRGRPGYRSPIVAQYIYTPVELVE